MRARENTSLCTTYVVVVEGSLSSGDEHAMSGQWWAVVGPKTVKRVR